MQTAKVLAEAVIPNEYGIDPAQKLRIGSKICNALLGKLLADLANMRDESLATAVSCWPSPAVQTQARGKCMMIERNNQHATGILCNAYALHSGNVAMLAKVCCARMSHWPPL